MQKLTTAAGSGAIGSVQHGVILADKRPPHIAFTCYVLIGTILTFTAGLAASFFTGEKIDGTS